MARIGHHIGNLEPHLPSDAPSSESCGQRGVGGDCLEPGPTGSERPPAPVGADVQENGARLGMEPKVGYRIPKQWLPVVAVELATGRHQPSLYERIDGQPGGVVGGDLFSIRCDILGSGPPSVVGPGPILAQEDRHARHEGKGVLGGAIESLVSGGETKTVVGTGSKLVEPRFDPAHEVSGSQGGLISTDRIRQGLDETLPTQLGKQPINVLGPDR